MTEKLDALRELLAKLEAGDFPLMHKTLSAAGIAHNSYGQDQRGYAWESFNGSLDAAKALHEAVLPEWNMEMEICGQYTAVSVANDETGQWEEGADNPYAEPCNPARAWLIAVIKALIAQEEA